MKITSKIIAPFVIVVLIGGILLSMGLDLWKTKSSKIPARYTSGRFAGAYNPADIRGSYTFGDIAASFDVTTADLAKAFGMENYGDNIETLRASTLESIYGELENGEIGTDSVRYFVALYTGKPYVPEESTLLPAPALQMLKGKVNEEQLEALKDISVSLSGLTPAAESAEHTETEEHGEGDTMIRGKTTFGDLLDWGLTKEEIEDAIGMEMGKTGITIRDHVAQAGMGFGEVKTKLQTIVDSK